MTIGIGGAGSKLAAKLDPAATIVNVSATELRKVEAENHILATIHASHGQFRGSRKDPAIGYDGFLSIRRELLGLVRGDMVFSSTGGGTGNGMAAGILSALTDLEDVPPGEKTFFGLILPYAPLEPAEFVRNTINFLQGPLSEAIDSGNTGNILLFSNRLKFESRLAEDAYNGMIVDSLNVFLSVPDKNDELPLLDGHIDHEDFRLYMSRPYFNYYTYFPYDPDTPFEAQLNANPNPLLLPSEAPIEALFLLEVPAGGDPTLFYEILKHFTDRNVSPVYSVVENAELDAPLLTVSLLYSRKPAELLDDFNKISEKHAQAKVEKSLEQYVTLPKLEVSLEKEAKKAAKQRGTEEDVLAVLKRLGKL